MTVQNDKLEQISALMDGEHEDVQSAIDMLLKDEQARDAWSDMHLNKDIANGAERKASTGFADGVMAALKDEPTVLVPQASKSIAKDKRAATVLPFLRPVAGLAIAATVAAVTILSFDNLSSGTAPIQQGPSIAAVAPEVAPVVVQQPAVVPVTFTGSYDASDRTYWQGSDENTQNELNRYLANHAEHANPGGYQSMVPYVRLAGYDSNQ